jgi:hypothetical protein
MDRYIINSWGYIYDSHPAEVFLAITERAAHHGTVRHHGIEVEIYQTIESFKPAVLALCYNIAQSGATTTIDTMSPRPMLSQASFA